MMTAMRRTGVQCLPFAACDCPTGVRALQLTQLAQDVEAREPEFLIWRLCDGDNGTDDRGRDGLVRVGHAQQHTHQAHSLLLLELELVISRERPKTSQLVSTKSADINRVEWMSVTER